MRQQFWGNQRRFIDEDTASTSDSSATLGFLCHSYRVILALAFRRIVAVVDVSACCSSFGMSLDKAAAAGRQAILLNELGLDEPVDLVEELVYVIDGSGGESMFTSTVLVGIDGLTAPHIVLPSVFGTRLQIGQRS